MRAQNEFVQVSTMVDSVRTANKIAKKLLDKRLASCVQVLGPVRSSYWWKGRIEVATEWFCFIKAKTRDYRRIESSIRREHPYEVPEILATPVVAGNPDYLKWIREETSHR